MTREAKLLGNEGTAFEQALLKSVRGESPSKALSSQMMGPLVGPPPVVEPSSGLATSAAVKWVVASVAALGIGTAILLGTRAEDDPGEARVPAQQTALANQTEQAVDEDEAAEDSNGGTETAKPTSPERNLKSPDAPASLTSNARAPVPRKQQGAESDQLAEEMRLLDQARAALAQKTPGKALRLLGAYDSRYPTGTLRQEATVLRVTALKATGQQNQAEELTDKFLEESPNSAHKSRLQAEDGAQEAAR